ncbi:MAG: LuxR C-terminal-related transcriptional regulator [Myxococcota bacterium]
MLGQIVIADSDAESSSRIAAQCARVRAVKVFGTARACFEHFRSSRPLTALVVDRDLPDRDGFELVRSAKASWPLLPILVFSRDFSATLINEGARLGVTFMAKQNSVAGLRAFLDRSVALERVSEVRLSLAVRNFAERHQLSLKETEVLSAGVEGVARKRIADQLGVSENTLKSCVKTILRKCGQTSLQEIRCVLLIQALNGSAHSDAEWRIDTVEHSTV